MNDNTIKFINTSRTNGKTSTKRGIFLSGKPNTNQTYQQLTKIEQELTKIQHTSANSRPMPDDAPVITIPQSRAGRH
jgi:hypothetical protein